MSTGDSKHVETVVALLSGEPLRVRLVRPDDESRLAAMAAGMVPEDLRPRFFTEGAPLSADRLGQLARRDIARGVVLVAEAAKTSEFLGTALSHAAEDRRAAEFAIVVRSDWKGRGIGWMLMQHLTDRVRESDIGILWGEVTRANVDMISAATWVLS